MKPFLPVCQSVITPISFHCFCFCRDGRNRTYNHHNDVTAIPLVLIHSSPISTMGVFNQCPLHLKNYFSGSWGIRTPGPFQIFGFQDRHDRPLCQTSKEWEVSSSYGMQHPYCSIVFPISHRFITYQGIFIMRNIQLLLPNSRSIIYASSVSHPISYKI